MTKAEIIRPGRRLGVDYGLTLVCYDPAPDGAACGRCDSCALRAQGVRRGRRPRPHALPALTQSPENFCEFPMAGHT